MSKNAGKSSRGVAVGLGALLAVVAVVAVVLGRNPNMLPFGGSGKSYAGPLRIVAATELDGLKPALEKASEELGFPIEVEAPDGTIQNTNSLIAGDFDNNFDATWFATNRYIDIYGGAGKLAEGSSVATSPVVLGVRSAKARELGWNNKQPTWAEVSQAVNSGKLNFGMTDPASSNSGFSALTAVTTANVAGGGELNVQDITSAAPKLQKFFGHQTVTSGSSGWLAENYKNNPEGSDALFNYESVLHNMRKEGTDFTVVVPADGVISADYPLTPLQNPKNEDVAGKVQALTEWFENNPDALTKQYLRPAAADQESLPTELRGTSVAELPFPTSKEVATALQNAYYNEYRKEGSTAFVLDVSGSMEGERMALLKRTMLELIDSDEPGLAFRDREEVTLMPFAKEVKSTTKVNFQRGGASQSELTDAIHSLTPGGTTGLYSALAKAYDEIAADGSAIPSIVVMSDGETNRGMDFDEFRSFFGDLPPEKQRVPVFVIMYGEADVQELRQLVSMTGGAEFNALDGSLNLAFKEIRGYQ